MTRRRLRIDPDEVDRRLAGRAAAHVQDPGQSLAIRATAYFLALHSRRLLADGVIAEVRAAEPGLVAELRAAGGELKTGALTIAVSPEGRLICMLPL
jgi:hypothetical protein